MTQYVSLDTPVSEREGLSRRRLLQLGGLTAAGLCVPWSATAWADSTPATASYTPTFLRFAYYGNPTAAGTERWQWQGLQGDRARPSFATVPEQYVYADTVKRSGDPTGITQCMRPGDVANAWLLRDRSGAVIHRDSNDDYALDVGNSAYRNAAADFLVRKCQTERWSGILLDEVNPTISWAFPGAVPARYPTDAAWQGALRGFVQVLASRLKAAGFGLVGNVGTAEKQYRAWCESLVRVGMVCNSEFFVCGGYGTNNVATLEDGTWAEQMDWMEWAQANGPRVLVHDKQDDDKLIRYGVGSFLLADTGKGVYGADVNYGADTRYPVCFDEAKQLGSPIGVRTQVQPGVWRRDFSSGYVLVNSSTRATTYQGRPVPSTSGTIVVTSEPVRLPPSVPAVGAGPAAPGLPPTPPPLPDWLSMLLEFLRRLFGL